MKAAKLKAYERGHLAENLAAAYLTLRGYRVLRRRYKTPMGEIDIVAKKRGALIMVEVKTRKSAADAIESVTPKNRRRVAQAALHYLTAHPEHSGLDVRFDVIIMGWPFYWRHLDNAWQAHT